MFTFQSVKFVDCVSKLPKFPTNCKCRATSKQDNCSDEVSNQCWIGKNENGKKEQDTTQKNRPPGKCTVTFSKKRLGKVIVVIHGSPPIPYKHIKSPFTFVNLYEDKN